MSKKIYTQHLKATVAKHWCLEQLNTFSLCDGRCPRTNQVRDMCSVGRLFQRHHGLAAANARSSRRHLVQVSK